jgi:hypothetical protein
LGRAAVLPVEVAESQLNSVTLGHARAVLQTRTGRVRQGKSRNRNCRSGGACEAIGTKLKSWLRYI